MRDLRGLTIVVATADRDRFGAALTMASAQGALGGRSRLYLDEAAVALLVDAAALATALELGVEVVACQTGLAAGVALPAGVDAGGMIGLLAALGEDRLVTL